ncbi:SEL1-like repeat protein [Sphingopyxis sp. MWB1]|uniref:SEL1-like repeat protein n=1 Tax=Sphingopyxis sp. MWB1 TaxID=1537715 RepID=UPI00118646EF|nr:SEL1-like repeat protein [Sphingopyxis sp. MWB1]
MSDSNGFLFRKHILSQLAAVLLLASCSSNVYMGISLTEGVGDPELRSLAQRASVGDKQAQLDLGIRYEQGNGVERDLAQAKRLYRLAASDSGGRMWVYIPGVSGSSGRVMQVGDAPFQVGLEAAQKRLEVLDHEI